MVFLEHVYMLSWAAFALCLPHAAVRAETVLTASLCCCVTLEV